MRGYCDRRTGIWPWTCSPGKPLAVCDRPRGLRFREHDERRRRKGTGARIFLNGLRRGVATRLVRVKKTDYFRYLEVANPAHGGTTPPNPQSVGGANSTTLSAGSRKYREQPPSGQMISFSIGMPWVRNC